MTDYEKQAQDFLNVTATTLKIEYLKTAPMSFDHDGQGRDIYTFTLTRKGRSYSSEFGQSPNCSGKFHFCGNPRRGINHGREDGGTSHIYWLRAGESTAYFPDCWDRNPEFAPPSAYDILACLDTTYGNADLDDDIDDFAADFCYEKISEAILVFRAVKEQGQSLMMMYNEEECRQLAEIA